MKDLITELIASLVCLFKKHNYISMGQYDQCVRCGKLIESPQVVKEGIDEG